MLWLDGQAKSWWLQVNTIRRQLGVRVAGFDPPRPVQTFAQLGLDAALLAAIKRAGWVVELFQLMCAAFFGINMLLHYGSASAPIKAMAPIRAGKCKS